MSSVRKRRLFLTDEFRAKKKAYDSWVFSGHKGIKYVKHRKLFYMIDVAGVICAVCTICTVICLVIYQQHITTSTDTRKIINTGRTKEVKITCENSRMVTIITDYLDQECRSLVPYSNITIYENEAVTVTICGSNKINDGPILVYAVPMLPLLLAEGIEQKLVRISFENGFSRYLPPLIVNQVNNLVIMQTRIIDETKNKPLQSNIISMKQDYEPVVTPTATSCEPMYFNPFLAFQTMCGWKRLTLEIADDEIKTKRSITYTALISQILATLVIWRVIGLVIIYLKKSILWCSGVDSEQERHVHMDAKATSGTSLKTIDLEDQDFPDEGSTSSFEANTKDEVISVSNNITPQLTGAIQSCPHLLGDLSWLIGNINLNERDNLSGHFSCSEKRLSSPLMLTNHCDNSISKSNIIDSSSTNHILKSQINLSCARTHSSLEKACFLAKETGFANDISSLECTNERLAKDKVFQIKATVK